MTEATFMRLSLAVFAVGVGLLAFALVEWLRDR